MLVQDSVLVESPHHQPAMGMELHLSGRCTNHAFLSRQPTTSLVCQHFLANLHLRVELPAASHHARFVHYVYLVDVSFSALF
jgi:hypothetical protein